MPESAVSGGGRGALFPGKPLLAFGGRESGHLPEWRNWQTRKIQVLVQVTGWRFKSSLGHFRGFSSPGSIPRRPLWLVGIGSRSEPCRRACWPLVMIDLRDFVGWQQHLQPTPIKSQAGALRAMTPVASMRGVKVPSDYHGYCGPSQGADSMPR